jgi:hypothetical protein
MNERKTLRELLIFLGRVMDDPSKLSPTKLNAEIAAAARLEARGWKHLAGEGGDIDELITLVGEGTSQLLRNRNVPESHGRRVGSKEAKYVDKDAVVIAEITRGVKKHIAIYRHYPIRKQYPAHARRINRALEKIEAETRKTIALQTVDIK